MSHISSYFHNVRLIISLTLALLLGLVTFGEAIAQGLPPGPFIYSGTATAGGVSVPNGFTIRGVVGDYVSAPVVVTDGRFELLTVNPGESVSTGSQITFLLDDIQADQTDTFKIVGIPYLPLV